MTDYNKDSELYYSEDEGFLSEPQFYQVLKSKGIKITHKDLKAWLAAQETVQLTKANKKQRTLTQLLAPHHKVIIKWISWCTIDMNSTDTNIFYA